MGYSNRVFSATGAAAEGQKTYDEYIYNDVTGSLSIGKPLYVDVRDAGEFNGGFGGLAITATKLSPVTQPTGGRVVLGTTAAGVGANATCVGIYAPNSISDRPANGDPVRVITMGRAIVSAQSPAAGAAGLVGSKLIASTAVTDAVPGAAVVDLTLGTILATATFVAAGNSIFAAASATATLINAFVKLS